MRRARIFLRSPEDLASSRASRPAFSLPSISQAPDPENRLWCRQLLRLDHTANGPITKPER